MEKEFREGDEVYFTDCDRKIHCVVVGIWAEVGIRPIYKIRRLDVEYSGGLLECGSHLIEHSNPLIRLARET